MSQTLSLNYCEGAGLDTWTCPHCLGHSNDMPWVYFLFSWHEMDCPLRLNLKQWVTIPAPAGQDHSGKNHFIELRA